MSSSQRRTEDRARLLMMAALDEEISEEQRKELESLLDRDAALREEWVRLQRVKEVTATMKYGEPPGEIWDAYWVSVYNRFERGIGWVLVSIGTTVLLGYAAWTAVGAFLAESSMPPLLKLAIAAVAVGVVVIVASIVRERWFTHRREPYKEIQR